MLYLSLLHPEPLPLWQSTADPYSIGDTQTQLCLSFCGGLWVLVHTRFVWALWASLAGMGFDFKCHFAPPTNLLGLFFALGHGVSLQSHSSTTQPPLQHHPSCWGFSALGLEVCPQSRCTAAQPPLQRHFLAGEWRDGAKAKTTLSVDVTGDRSKAWCCKEQYCIGTWNVRSMNQSKLEVVKQEMV